jgi:osmoprotectant transport system substrate-binding protein
MRNRIKLLVAVATAFALLASACAEGDDFGGDTDTGNGAATEEGEAAGPLAESTITVGSKDFDEQLVLGYLTVELLSDAGATVNDEVNLGGTDAARQALLGGDIDVYWEYNGTAWISFFGETDPIPDRIEQYEVVRDRDLEENSLVWLDPAQFNNTYALAMSQEGHQELGSPETLSDIGPLLGDNPDLSVCVEVEFEGRDDGLPGMEEHYGYEFDNVEILDTGLIYDQTAAGACDFGEVFTSDGRIAALDLVVLDDDQGFFPLYNPSPVFRQDVYDSLSSELDDLFDPVADALSMEAMQELNRRVSEAGEDPRTVARDWLETNGFIGG